MKQFIIYSCLCTLICICRSVSHAQNSVLINFGSNTCYNSAAPSFSLINNPLGGSPSVIASCSMSAQLPDFFAVFIAYNPKDNKVYIADIRSGTDTKIWVLNMGLPQNISCPVNIPATPTFSYGYVSNNFEFDNNGDLWSLSNYNVITGQCNMDKFDVTTGTVINSRVLQFPAGNFPTTITSGDLTILPNGRMFATLGSSPSRLYEINNYSSTSINASATFLQTMPKDCYGIAYINGQLEITGIDFASSSCYYFDYAISSNTLGSEKPFQTEAAPIDNTSFTPSVGTTKQLLNAVKINASTADLTYEIYVKNLGNVILNNINATDDLATVFGAANISNVVTSFVPGANAAGLSLNTAYNGSSITTLLNEGQNLANQTTTSDNYFFKVLLQCRVTNLNPTILYLNSAVGKGIVGNSINGSLINVSDSSNNGSLSAIDPNNNGNAGEPGENIPTPFNFGVIPVKFINASATFVGNNSSLVRWTVATPTVNAKNFEVEWSTNGRNWSIFTSLSITDPGKGSYQINHSNIPQGNLYYRIKQTDFDGAYIYSRIILLHGKNKVMPFIIYPNPANNYIEVLVPGNYNGKARVELFDAVGKKVLDKQLMYSNENLPTSHLPEGYYLLKVLYDDGIKTQKLLILH